MKTAPPCRDDVGEWIEMLKVIFGYRGQTQLPVTKTTQILNLFVRSKYGSQYPENMGAQSAFAWLNGSNEELIGVGRFEQIIQAVQCFSIERRRCSNSRSRKGCDFGLVTVIEFTFNASDGDVDNDGFEWIKSGDDGALFSLDTTTGATVKATFIGTLDYETQTSYALTVTTSDVPPANGGTAKTAGKSVTVTVNDVNEHTPVITADQETVVIDEGLVIELNERFDSIDVFVTVKRGEGN